MQHTEEQSLRGQDNPNKTILVVEDDDSIGSLLIEALSLETSYDAVLVTDAFQAMRVIHSIKPCLFITDYRLPQMDGIELYDRLQTMGDIAGTPAIIMSAHMPENEVRKRHLVSLHKPFELDDLLNTVERLLSA